MRCCRHRCKNRPDTTADIMTRQSSHDKKLLNGTKPGCGLQQQQTAVCVCVFLHRVIKHPDVFKT